jgi:DNA-directed RNA polymerase subunit M/transcription elongation factor TFIIS
MSKAIRNSVCQRLKKIFEADAIDVSKVDQVARKIENTLYQESIRAMVQNPDACWKPIYQGLYSNLFFNLETYIHHEGVVGRLMDDPLEEMSRILINGPMALNEELKEIGDLKEQEGGAYQIKLSSNTGGQVRCPSCRQTEVYRRLVQDRGGDEAFSSYFTCLNEECNHLWRRGG